MDPPVLSPTQELISWDHTLKEWDFSEQWTEQGFLNHILKGQAELPSWLVLNLQQTQVAFLLGSHISSVSSAKVHIPFPVTTHSLTLGQGGRFLHPFEVTASAALWTPWQWAFGDSCRPRLRQQLLHLTWQWPCVLPGTLGGRPILLSPGQIAENIFIMKTWDEPLWGRLLPPTARSENNSTVYWTEDWVHWWCPECKGLEEIWLTLWVSAQNEKPRKRP